MYSESLDAKDKSGVAVHRTTDAVEQIAITGTYDVKCYDAEGSLKWEDAIKNLVVTVGKNDLLIGVLQGLRIQQLGIWGL
jgi:hypothetical protein